MSHRNSHYGLWFLIFGAIPFIQAAQSHFPANLTSYTAYWLVGAGAIGLLLGQNWVAGGGLARPFDLIAGIVFTLAGIVGILGDFHFGVSSLTKLVQNVGLNLGALYPLVYTFLGLKSVHHGLEKSKG